MPKLFYFLLICLVLFDFSQAGKKVKTSKIKQQKIKSSIPQDPIQKTKTSKTKLPQDPTPKQTKLKKTKLPQEPVPKQTKVKKTKLPQDPTPKQKKIKKTKHTPPPLPQEPCDCSQYESSTVPPLPPLEPEPTLAKVKKTKKMKSTKAPQDPVPKTKKMKGTKAPQDPVLKVKKSKGTAQEPVMKQSKMKQSKDSQRRRLAKKSKLVQDKKMKVAQDPVVKTKKTKGTKAPQEPVLKKVKGTKAPQDPVIKKIKKTKVVSPAPSAAPTSCWEQCHSTEPPQEPLCGENDPCPCCAPNGDYCATECCHDTQLRRWTSTNDIIDYLLRPDTRSCIILENGMETKRVDGLSNYEWDSCVWEYAKIQRQTNCTISDSLVKSNYQRVSKAVRVGWKGLTDAVGEDYGLMMIYIVFLIMLLVTVGVIGYWAVKVIVAGVRFGKGYSRIVNSSVSDGAHTTASNL